MAIPMVSGPANFYVARQAAFPYAYPASKATIYFLGTCEQPPTLQLNPQWEPVMNDVGGSLLPIDYSYQGEDGLISGTLNKWNELIYTFISSHGLAQGGTARGTELWSDIGTLSQVEGISLQVWIQFPYASKTPYAAQGMPGGYHFKSCRLAGHVIGPGTRAGRRQLILHADRSLSESATASLSVNSLYDNTMTYIPTVPPILATGAIP